MILKVILTRVVEHLNGRVTSGLDPTFTNQELKALEAINRAYKQMNYFSSNGRGFPWMTKRYTFLTTAPFSTGTVTINNGSRTVTHSATGFTAAMLGRKLKATEHDEVYTIDQFTSTSALELDRAYQGTGGAGLAYAIQQDEYDLPADFHTPLYASNPDDNFGLDLTSINDLFHELPNDFSTGKPGRYAIAAHKSREGAVTTLSGTLTFTDGSTAVSATSGAFTTELLRGDLIRKEVAHVTGTESGTLWRQVESITDDDNLVLTQAWDGTTGTTTTAQRQDGWLKMILRPYPNDATLHTLYYIRWLPDLRDLRNIPEMPDYYHEGIIHGALMDMWEDKDDARTERAERKFREWKDRLRNDFGYGGQTMTFQPELSDPGVTT